MTTSECRLASAANLLSQCRRFLLDPGEATALIAEMEQAVGQEWYGVARGCGVSEADCEAVRRAYVYAGFRS